MLYVLTTRDPYQRVRLYSAQFPLPEIGIRWCTSQTICPNFQSQGSVVHLPYDLSSLSEPGVSRLLPASTSHGLQPVVSCTLQIGALALTKGTLCPLRESMVSVDVPALPSILTNKAQSQ